MSLGREEMDELSLLKKMERVKAPPGFEQSVMARLSLERRAADQRWPALGFSLAGGFAALLAVFVGLNVFVLRQQQAPVTASKMEAGSARAAAQQLIPVIETFDYAAEIRSRAPESGTIYLLEQVSDKTPRGITY